MYYRGAEGKIINDRLYSRSYSMDAILIKPNGDIDSDFQKEFEKAYKAFIIECSGSLYYEDFTKNKLHKPQLQPFIPSAVSNKPYQKNTYNPPDENKVSAYVQRAIEGNQRCLEILRRIVIDGGTHESQLVARLFKENYKHGHPAAKSVYLKLAEDISLLPFIDFRTEPIEQEGSKIYSQDTHTAQTSEECLRCYYFGNPNYKDLCARRKPSKNCLSFSPRVKIGQPID